MIRQQLGDLLVSRGDATPEQIGAALRAQRTSPKRLRLGRILVQQGVLDEVTLADALAEAHGMRSIDLDLMEVEPAIARLLTKAVAERHVMVPIEATSDHMTVAVSDPVDVFALDDLKARLPHHQIRMVVAPSDQIRKLLVQSWGEQKQREAVAQLIEAVPENETEMTPPDTDEGAAALVNQLLKTGANQGASDIHVEPQPEGIRVRIRVDGTLRDLMQLPKESISSVTARIKIVSGLDVFDRRTPQDGRTRVRIEGHDRDIRVSTLPTIHGEKIVMRLLPTHDRLPSLEQLGLSPQQVQLLRETLQRPQGLVLVTGPTGSGKSNTLYAALVDTMDDERNVVTIEDPVEVEIRGITQVQINEPVGLTFDAILRAALRQDPDVLLVGEIRDTATGNLALRAALTGHLVLSTLHTLDGPGSVVRLLDLGLPPYLVAASVSLVVSQRLIRRNCRQCAAATGADPEVCGLLGIAPHDAQKLVAGAGCPACDYTGYRGRIGVFDLLEVTPGMRQIIGRGGDEAQLREAARAAGWRPLIDRGIQLALAGITTPEEILRVINLPGEAGTELS